MKFFYPTIGQYFPAESLVHRLDPRIKIILTMFLMVTIFTIKKYTGFFFVILFLILAVLLSELPFRWVLKGLRPLKFVLLVTFFIHLFFTPGLIFYKIGFLKITEEGLTNGLFFSLRLILLVAGASILTLTTTPIELTDAIEYLLSPFKRFKVPAHELAMMMTIALRFIPTLLMEAERILKAQVSRGADFESRNILKRAESLIPFVIPLFVSAFRRADELALAMESRCYRGGEGRTRLRALEMNIKDWLALFLS
ncbi:MAG: energy-coupling factor transporter transmembrane component T, partial [Candidatus Subteraquimicrobiales bacterium]|nr:energy-coupling factor transporter transmembrane component T [Candidatus Subteraquimicrobiales bacterium]